MRIDSRREEDGKPAMRQRRRWSAWPLAFLIAMSAGACVPSFVKSVEEDHSTYYRLKVKLTYKGEPQDFDIVVGCNVRQIFYKDNSSTYEAGLVPSVFGRRMSDGKGLVVRPPNACEGETTGNGKVQSDLLPIMVVYDNAETLDFGIAYLSQDAYESPLSVLVFGGATIDKATRPEFDDFRRTQPNLVKRESYHKALGGDSALKRMNLSATAIPWAHVCEGYERYLVPEELRSTIQQRWPGGHPRYWQADTGQLEHALTDAILPSDHTDRHLIRSDGLTDPLHPTSAFGSIRESEADYGMPTRAGGGLVSPARVKRFPPAYYPAASDYRLDRWPTDRQDWSAFIAAHDRLSDVVVDFRGGQTRGFAYCFTRVFPTGGQVSSNRRAIGRVEDSYVFSKEPLSRMLSPGSSVPEWIFERDEYVLRHFGIYLESTRGDV
jgi:hypothetical protein